jgi:hypothetical protein
MGGWFVGGRAATGENNLIGNLMSADKTKSPAKDKAPKEKAEAPGKTEAKTEASSETKPEAKADAPKNYSRGEGQKASLRPTKIIGARFAGKRSASSSVRKRAYTFEVFGPAALVVMAASHITIDRMPYCITAQQVLELSGCHYGRTPSRPLKNS